MPDRLEADTVLLHVSGGHPRPEDPPGLAAFPPPRRVARGREKDLLFLCLGLRSRAPVAPERYAELLHLAAAAFYGGTGSITAALRQALSAVNQDLLDHNLRESAGGAPMQGGFICAALRGMDFYAVQCGPGLVLVAHKTGVVERFPNLPSRPLGLSDTLDAHYFHTAVDEAEYFGLSSTAPAGWTEIALVGLGGLATLTNVLERLKDMTTDDFAALVGRFEPAGTATAPRVPTPSISPWASSRPATPEPAGYSPRAGLPGEAASAGRPRARGDRLPAVTRLTTSLGEGLRAGFNSLASLIRPRAGALKEDEMARPAPAEAPPEIYPGEVAEASPLAVDVPKEVQAETPGSEAMVAASPAADLSAQQGEPGAASPVVPQPAAQAVSAPPIAELSRGIPEAAREGQGGERGASSPESESTMAGAAPATDWTDLLRRAERLGGPEPLPTIPIIEETPPARPAAAAESGATAPGTIPDRVKHGFRSLGRALGVTLTEANRGLRKLLARMLPEGVLQKEGMFTVPTSVQIAIAVVIPLLVVGLVAFLYIQRGRAEQFSDTLSQAQLEVATARVLNDPIAARPHWESALTWLAQAEKLRPGDSKVGELRQEAQGKLDDLDWITRLDFRPLVIGGLSRGLGRDVNVTQILLVGRDVYVLDDRNNRVLRLTPSANDTGYTIDLDFECSSGSVGEFTIGTLVDIGLVPGPNLMGSDAVVALDTTGGLLYCAQGNKPLATYLAPPDTSWIRPTAIEVYADRLYVLDPGGNEIWQFQASGGAFNQKPLHYFTGVAYDLQDVIEFSIAAGDLFLLRKDGRVTLCTRPATGEPANCTEAVQFSDQRKGRASGDRLTDVRAPTRLMYSAPPEPSLYLLDRETGGLYQLSLKLVLVRQYRSRLPLPPITSVAVDLARQIFVGAGDNVYVAARP